MARQISVLAEKWCVLKRGSSEGGRASSRCAASPFQGGQISALRIVPAEARKAKSQGAGSKFGAGVVNRFSRSPSGSGDLAIGKTLKTLTLRFCRTIIFAATGITRFRQKETVLKLETCCFPRSSFANCPEYPCFPFFDASPVFLYFALAFSVARLFFSLSRRENSKSGTVKGTRQVALLWTRESLLP